jgi:hypothetical protein
MSDRRSADRTKWIYGSPEIVTKNEFAQALGKALIAERRKKLASVPVPYRPLDVE